MDSPYPERRIHSLIRTQLTNHSNDFHSRGETALYILADGPLQVNLLSPTNTGQCCKVFENEWTVQQNLCMGIREVQYRVLSLVDWHEQLNARQINKRGDFLAPLQQLCFELHGH